MCSLVSVCLSVCLTVCLVVSTWYYFAIVLCRPLSSNHVGFVGLEILDDVCAG